MKSRSDIPTGLESLLERQGAAGACPGDSGIGRSPWGACSTTWALALASTLLESGLKLIWRQAWQSAPVLMPGESHGPRSLAGYSPLSNKVKLLSDFVCLSIAY